MNTRRISQVAASLAAVTLGFASINAAFADTDHGEHATPVEGISSIMTNMGWNATEYDTCSEELHDTYSVVAPDGLRYETWHPSVVTDPATGLQCTFGHEHGDDPETSEIFDFVAEKLSAEGHEDEAGIPFGYAAEASTAYSESTGLAVAHRHEDHVGQKVFVLNNVNLINSDRTQGYVRDASGAPVTCDYLLKMHQGSHSSDATKNNAHEILYGMQCSDGTEMVTTHLATLGDANEFTRVCAQDSVITSGSTLPDGEGGRRLIPDTECLSVNDDAWNTYEIWELDEDLTTATGESIASFDPWFGVRNPSRIYDSATADTANGGIPTITYFGGAAEDKNAPGSAFDGAQRDVYVAESTVRNASGPSTWYTDPYGGNGATEPFAGSVKQYISQSDNTSLPTLERQAFGFSTDYGTEDTGVHAPN